MGYVIGREDDMRLVGRERAREGGADCIIGVFYMLSF